MKKITGTKKLLAEKLLQHRKEFCEWATRHAEQAPPPFYCSVDLRDSGHKVVPVDSNLYPAGFNNICPEDLRTAPPVFRKEVEALTKRMGKPMPKNILVLPESHTSNVHYVENIYYLMQIIRDAGFETRLGWYGPIPEGPEGMEVPLQLKSATEKIVLAYPIKIEGGTVSTDGFVPDLILLNNDFSSGYPKPLDSVTQPILPSHFLGWHTRKKSEHFRYYNELAAEAAQLLGIDPWHLQIDTEEVGPVNFDEDQGTDKVAQIAEQMFARLEQSYKKHKVEQKPFVFVKNNSGTYGMGIMVVHSPEELRKMNRRTKHKMSIGKNKMAIESVAVQEGIPTTTIIDRLAAEPVIYLLGDELIGGFLRTNTEKGVEENLNSQGMVFRKLCMSDLRDPEFEEEYQKVTGNIEKEPVLELIYGSIARISALATGKELAARNAREARQAAGA